MKIKYFLLLTAWGISLSGWAFEVKPEKAMIVIAENAGSPQRFAALELQRHFELITGVKVPVAEGGKAPVDAFPFYVGIKPAGGTEKLLPEEAVWHAKDNGVWLYGDDAYPTGKKGELAYVKIWNQPTGTLTAVYDFLEKEFGVRWLEPGNGGIVYQSSPVLRFNTGEGRWNPGQLVMRKLRVPPPWNYYSENIRETIAPQFRMTREQYEEMLQNYQIWVKRQRMGQSLALSYGHAFTKWYANYGKEHPDWFAMHPDGSRKLRGKPIGAKLCVSNPEVVKQVVALWSANKPVSINTCENDGGFFCNCPNCLALDVRLPDERLEDHLTDRYLNFTNRVLTLPQKERPDVVAVMYAYSYYKFPPRRERVMPNTVIGFVPSMMQQGVGEMYERWYQAGARKIFLRPNDGEVNIGLPMGFEKCMFDAFQLGIKYGIIGTDYVISGYWPATGIADYILARGHSDPSKPFEYWENEYYAAFGGGAEKVRDYYQYWRREVWDARIFKDRKRIMEQGRYDNFQRGLMWHLGNYYRVADFDTTDAMLVEALAACRNPQEKQRIENLQLANRHARMSFATMTEKGERKKNLSTNLYEFRLQNRDRLNFNWGRLLEVEQRYGDVAGVNTAGIYCEFSAFQQLRLQWRFMIDPGDVGLKEKWYEQSENQISSTWDQIRVNMPWEQQYLKEMRPELKKQLSNYDGIGWYSLSFPIDPSWKGSEIHLYFGAVDESAWVWLNGRKSGERIYVKGSDQWREPFTIRIDEQIDWNKKRQNVVVRVEDTGGQGGIWKPVAVVKK